MNDFRMTIDGQQIAGERRFPVINPSTGEPFADAPDCTQEQLDLAMEAAQRAFPTWKQDTAKRRQALRDCAAVLGANAETLAPIFTRENGRPLWGAMQEVQWAAGYLQAIAEHELPIDVLQDDAEARIELHRKPYGVVAGLTPWNFPLSMAAWKIGQALLTGNTLVLKPSPYTPLSTLKLGELLSTVLPPGVLNIVSGGNELGAAMTTHPAVRKITLTGSISTGKKVLAAAAADLKQVTLELGGNDPAIILEDADLTQFAQLLFWSAFYNSGQACIAIKRIYAHEAIYPAVVQTFAGILSQVKMGDGFDSTVQLGPLSNKMQFERVVELVEDAKRAGARMETGGTARPGKGYFFEPTIVTDICDGTRLVDEEQFGPVLPIIPFRDVEDAIQRANGTHYGLGASVWTGDLDKGMDIASQLECGTSWVNNHGTLSPHIPFGGAKWSGVGYEHGKWGMEAYTRLQVVRVARVATSAI